MHETAASWKDIVRVPVTNWEPQCVTLAGYYAVRYEIKVQLVTPYCVTNFQRYEVKLRGNKYVPTLKWLQTLTVNADVRILYIVYIIFCHGPFLEKTVNPTAQASNFRLQ